VRRRNPRSHYGEQRIMGPLPDLDLPFKTLLVLAFIGALTLIAGFLLLINEAFIHLRWV
jgi:hypothetical protein